MTIHPRAKSALALNSLGNLPAEDLKSVFTFMSEGIKQNGNATTNAQSYLLDPKAELDGLLRGIEETSKQARSLVLTLSTTCAYVLIAALSGTVGESIKLPIVNNEIPTGQFFVWSPLVVLSIYLYLQVYVQELIGRFNRLHEFQYRVNMSPRLPRDFIFPWLFVLALDSKRQIPSEASEDQFARNTSVPPAVGYLYPLAAAIVWLLGPCVLAILLFVFLRAQRAVAIIPCFSFIVAGHVAIRSMHPIRSRLQSGAWGTFSAGVLMLTLASVPALRQKTYLATLWNLRHTILQWSATHVLPFTVRLVALLAPVALLALASRFLYKQLLPLRLYRQRLARALGGFDSSPGWVESFYVPLRGTLRSNPSIEIQADTLLKHGQTALILGDPGAGKTTLLKILALRLAKDQNTDRHLVPIFLRLNRLDPHVGLFRLAQDSLQEFSVPDSSRLLTKLAYRGQAVFLLDGLDEVPIARRQPVAEAIRSLIVDFPACAVYITCRTADYNHELDNNVQDILTLLPLSSAEVDSLLRQRYPNDARQADQLVHEMRGAGVPNTPQTVLMAAIMAAQTSQIPISGTEIVEQFVRARLDSWDRARQIDLKFTYSEKARFLEQLAEELETRGQSELSYAESAQIAKAVAVEIGKSEHANELLVESFRSGLIVEHGGRTSFVHAVVKDYFLKTRRASEIA